MENKNYKILCAEDTESLEYIVNFEIKNHYFPIGGLLKEKKYSGGEKYYIYYQAMLFSEYNYAIKQEEGK